jgi:hypothetical protein
MYFFFVFLPSVQAEGRNKNKKYKMKEGIKTRSTS